MIIIYSFISGILTPIWFKVHIYEFRLHFDLFIFFKWRCNPCTLTR